MSTPIKKSFIDGIRLIKKATETNTSVGELEVVGDNLYFFGLTNDIVATLNRVQTLENKTLESPILNDPTINDGVGTFLDISLTNGNVLKLFELGVNGTDYVGIKAADNVSATYTITLPGTGPNAGEFLQHLAGGVYAWVPGTPTVSSVLSVTGALVGGTAQNPTVNVAVDGSTITGDGSPGNPLVATATSSQDLCDIRFVINGFIPTTAGDTLDGTAVVTQNCTVENFYASVINPASSAGTVSVKLQYRALPTDPWTDVTTDASFDETISANAYAYAGAPVQTGVTNPSIVVTTIPAGSQIRVFHVCSNNTFDTLSSGVQLRRV